MLRDSSSTQLDRTHRVLILLQFVIGWLFALNQSIIFLADGVGVVLHILCPWDTPAKMHSGLKTNLCELRQQNRHTLCPTRVQYSILGSSVQLEKVCVAHLFSKHDRGPK